MNLAKVFPPVLFGLALVAACAWAYQQHFENAEHQFHVVPQPTVSESLDNKIDEIRRDVTKTMEETSSREETAGLNVHPKEHLQSQIAKQQNDIAIKQDRLAGEEIDSYKKFNDYLIEQRKEEEARKSQPLPIIISALFGLASLYIIISKKYADEATKWACGTAGIILGFWLGGA